jgi:betaine-aldehyde dehydrogenase
MRNYDHFIGGADVPPATGTVIERLCPANGERVAGFAAGSESDVDDAVGAARAAFDKGPWPKMTLNDRARALRALAELMLVHQERLAQIETQEVGKPIRFSRKEIEGAAKVVHYAAGLAQNHHGLVYPDLKENQTGLILREPVGVVGCIIPWNFPAFVFCHKVPFALAAGCTVVVKPSEFTSGTAIEIARLSLEAGIPAGVINVVTGYGNPVGAALSMHPDVDFITFTGSTATGRKVMEAAIPSIKRVAMELGGKSANIVFADCDLDDAVDGTAFGVFHNTGQVCCAGSRLLVEHSIADRFLERLTGAISQIRVGDPFDDSTDIGALIHENHMERVLGYVQSGVREGAQVIAGGERLGGGDYERGWYVGPTVLDRVDRGSTAFSEEIFGPVLTVTRFTSPDEALAIANDTTYGLANAVWTKDLDKALGVSRGLRSGVVWVNTTLDVAPQMPFGGVKGSGFGREFGLAGLEEFTASKSIYLTTGSRRREYLRKT